MKHHRLVSKQAPAKAAAWQDLVCQYSKMMYNIFVALNSFLDINVPIVNMTVVPLLYYVAHDKCRLDVPEL